MTILDKGLDFTIPFWCESPTRISAGEDEGGGLVQTSGQKSPILTEVIARGDSHICTLDMGGHMGTSIIVPILNCISDLGKGVCGPENKAKKNMGHGPAQQHLKKGKEQGENLGSFLFNKAQILLIAHNIMPSSNTLDPILVEIEANTFIPDISPISAETENEERETTPSQIQSLNLVIHEETDDFEDAMTNIEGEDTQFEAGEDRSNMQMFDTT